MLAGVTPFSLALVMIFALAGAGLALAGPAEVTPQSVDREEYPVYDRVVSGKFLTSRTDIVFIGRLTVTQLGPGEHDLPSKAYFQERQLFAGLLTPALLTDFIIKNSRPGYLEDQFNFGTRYRFIPGDDMGEPQVSAAMPVGAVTQGPARPAQEGRRSLGLLRFSRVGFSPRQEQALVYVEEERPDGTGSGFLILLTRNDKSWDFIDTEILWVARPEDAPETP